jgi:alkylation response protein AidB-like acyl-CoA dehydrogenase
MHLEPSETQALVQKTASDFAARVLAPRAAGVDALGKLPDDSARALGALGLLAVNVPPDLGGAGAGPVAFALAVQEIAGACASTAVMMSVTNMVGETIARFGTPEQQARYCPSLASGERGPGSFALTEPDAGSDPGALRTTARRDGPDWVLDGRKNFITSGANADVFIVWARTGPAGAGVRGISCFLVGRDTAGFEVGASEDKLGLRGSSTVSLAFVGCRVPGSALLGPENEGFKVAMAALDGGRIGIASQAIGIARAALHESASYAKDRHTFGVPIARHQAIQFKLADMQVDVDAAHLLCMRAAWRKERGEPFGRDASMAKLFASEAALRVCNEAVQIHGGYGYVRDFPAERHLRDVRATTIYEGTSEIQRMVIARTL